MSSFEEGMKRGEFNPSKEDDKWYVPLSKVAPKLAGAIKGLARDAGDTEDRPGLTLMVFCRDGILKFSLSSQEWPRTYYGTVTHPDTLVEAIESALAANLGEWSVRKEKKAGGPRF